MHTFTTMMRILAAVFGVIGLTSSLLAKEPPLLASAWLEFPQAQIRLLASSSGMGGVEIRLKEGFKTYWKNPGDSGVPPVFELTTTPSMPVEVLFPFPTTFDDGAGGKAWGYKSHVVFPLRFAPTGKMPDLTLKLDFAVCGTMCIPLSGTVSLNGATASPAGSEALAALLDAQAHVPRALDSASPPRLRELVRLSQTEKPSWRLVIEDHGASPDMEVFFDSSGYLAVHSLERIAPSGWILTFNGDAPPGSGGTFGVSKLVFGTTKRAFETVIDLDGAKASP
jgi:Disulphide bond corrector protein DsbC